MPDRPAEQAAGATDDQARLIDAALAASVGGRRDWGICTECGMGRVNRDEIPALLDLHREIIAARSPRPVPAPPHPRAGSAPR
jgi:hypothetical protein